MASTEPIAAKSYHSIFRLMPKNADASGYMSEVLAFTAPSGIVGGIAFNSRNELLQLRY